ncbi:carbohydrate kinase family protein [Lysinibacillus sphaericus]|uniref:carbohydrate kinase family protein n=1 Tax=Lysinibacillus sphaericus TaxID=1421 RepID=UPI00190FE221|nr:carbohydrate kinase [Lysinibacillus sphaericus]QPA55970.1 carbohydrate kinase [Lysinibacillus sphaericus]
MGKLFTIGELLIDFTPTQQHGDLVQIEHFTKHAGGAPANVAAVCAKLGQQAALLTQIGQDAFGDFLKKTLQQAGVDTQYIRQTTEGETSLAFVALSETGERDFQFYRRHAADLLYKQEYLPSQLLTNKDIIHFCSVNLVDSPMKSAHLAFIEQAHQAGSIVSFDPNVRLPLWQDETACRETILAFLPKAHIVKLSNEELLFLTAIEEEFSAVHTLFQGHLETIIITHGAEGATLYTKKCQRKVHAENVQAVDTTGAGDAFIGAILSQFLQHQLSADHLVAYCEQYAISLLSFANRYAGITTMKYGAIPSYPELPLE